MKFNKRFISLGIATVLMSGSLNALDQNSRSTERLEELKQQMEILQKQADSLINKLESLEVLESNAKVSKSSRQLREHSKETDRSKSSHSYQNIFGFSKEFADHIEELNKMTQRMNSRNFQNKTFLGNATNHRNALEVTVTENNGNKKVTVLKDGKILAEDLLWENLDKLPKDVRQKVESLNSGKLSIKSFDFGDNFFKNDFLKFKLRERVKSKEKLRSLKQSRQADDPNRF